jgi:small subunit ribosomal protein S21
MSTVMRGDQESFDALMRRFKKVVLEDRILSTTRRNRFFEKPSQERKRKQARKLRKSRQTTRKLEERRW